MIDPELKYCPKCGDEYMVHIENCANCNVKLMTGQEKIDQENAIQQRIDNRNGTLSTDDNLVVLRGGPLAAMKELEAIFSKFNIGTMLAADEESCGGGCCPSTFRLLIREEDIQDALEILEKDLDHKTNIDDHDTELGQSVFNPHEAKTTCPACGHSFPPGSDLTCPDCGLCFG